MTENTVSKNDDSPNARQDPDTVLRPPVDIFEGADGITLVTDIPGVSKEGLNLQVDNDSLTVRGEVSIDTPDGMQALHAEVRSKRYERSFALSSELDVEAIEASLKHGVLQVRIPKRAEVRPRKIDVRVG